MMKAVSLVVALLVGSVTAFASSPAQSSALTFHSSDSTLQSSFDRAKEMALSYVGDDNDPVGAWYMAALPEREAFCIRDLCHQSVGAHLLGLQRQNYNMMQKMVANAAESRDWCSYWEIDRLDRPAPVDYKSDKEFWYNLNANNDLIVASWKLYNWTGDDRYLSAPEFTRFFNITTDCFIDRWKLSPDSIMSRPRFMNRAPEIQRGTPYFACRGIPSYTEGVRGLCVGIDLVAGLAAGNRAAALISLLNDSITIDREQLLDRANDYVELIDNHWWDADAGRYYAFFTETGDFAHGEGPMFTLWYDCLTDSTRRDACVKQIMSRSWNIENMSYLPALLLDLGYPADAYRLIGELPLMKRFDYPEVSYALVEAIVRAAMGISPDAVNHSLTTEYRLTNIDTGMSATGIPLFGGTISLAHDGDRSTTLTNNTPVTITWTPVIAGNRLKSRSIKPGKTATARR